MATGSGLSAQLGWKAETIYGTEVVVDRFLPFRSESFKDTYERSVADDILAGAQTVKQEQVRAGNKSFSGSVGLYLFNRNVAELFEMVLGANTTTGAGPYTHTVTPGELSGDSLTMQVGRPDLGGTVNVWTYKGCKASRLALAVTAGEYATMNFDVIAQDVDVDTPLATASYPASLRRWHADDLAVTIGGSSVCVRNIDIEIANNLDDTRRCVGSALIKEPLRNDLLTVSGSMEIEWTDLTHYNRVAGLTYAELVMAFAAGADGLTITADCRFDEASQPVAGRGVVYQTIMFKATGASTDADTITVEVVNADSVA